MTAPLAEADPAPEQPWRETSSPGIRRLALQACQAAIRAAQEPTDQTCQSHAPSSDLGYCRCARTDEHDEHRCQHNDTWRIA